MKRQSLRSQSSGGSCKQMGLKKIANPVVTRFQQDVGVYKMMYCGRKKGEIDEGGEEVMVE